MSHNELAVLLVTRRFWPHANDAAGRLASLAEGLRERGVRPTLLAARFAASWPSELSFREFEVVRPVAAPRGDWSAALYVRGLTRWLREQAPRFDVLYADNMREEGAAVVDAALRSRRAAVVRCGGVGAWSDVAWAGQSRGNRRTFQDCLKAATLLAPDAAAARGLISSGAKREQVLRCDDGVPAVIRRGTERQLAARAALQAINHDLLVPAGGRVVLVVADMHERAGLLDVAAGIVPLLEKDNELRVWFVGDGPQRELLHRTLVEAGIRHRVAMPGCFGHVDELLLASDVYVLPNVADGLEHRMPMAIASGVPVAIVNTVETRARFGGQAAELHWFEAENPATFTDALSSILNDYEQAEQRALTLRECLRQSQPREQQIDMLLRRLRQLAPALEAGDSGSAAESTA
ncbi:glycosyltransferase family 4 protein [Planctomycetaceae bacterium SH139]